jgi:phosphinothricin acetyltransferase
VTPLVEAATPADLRAVAAIYAYYVLAGPATFDLVPPPPERWQEVLAHLHPAAGHHLLVARVDGDVVGWVKSGAHREKPAYATSVETSVYVAHGATGAGVGGALYRALFVLLPAAGIHRAYAGITQPNPASVALHRRHGFRHVGTFTQVGRKFGRWWDVAWYERPV